MEVTETLVTSNASMDRYIRTQSPKFQMNFEKTNEYMKAT